MIKDKSIYEIEFELKDLFNSVKRNLKLFIICSSTISFLSFSYAQLKKKFGRVNFK